jgi:glycerol-3-phosphate O-acyltransferase
LGKILVKYADPINLKDYVDKFNQAKPPMMNQPFNLLELSMQLTKELYVIQQRETPINMNSIISSAMIFQPKREGMSFKNVKISCRNIYDHI